MVLPPFAIAYGCPAKIIGELPPSTSTSAASDARTVYKRFIPISTLTENNANEEKTENTDKTAEDSNENIKMEAQTQN